MEVTSASIVREWMCRAKVGLQSSLIVFLTNSDLVVSSGGHLCLCKGQELQELLL